MSPVPPDRTRASRRKLRLAVFGVLADGAGSSAASYPLLLRELLERGHDVDFFGNPGYVRPRSLESFEGYRFRPLTLEAMERLWYRFERFELSRALVAQLGVAAYQREALRQIERLDRERPYDLVLCTDIQPLWPSRLPLVAWPQGPPHTEATALWDPELARAVVRARGIRHFALVQAFYGYRVVTGRVAVGRIDLVLCGSRWATREWERFGAAAGHVEPFPYPIDTARFLSVPELAARPTTTFLWLGRAAPRKRLDLFLEAFSRLRARHADVCARIVGNVGADALSRGLLERYASTPGLTVEASIERRDVPALFGAVDVLVQPSQHENFGFSVAEALAAGRPVVGGPTNGTIEYAGEGGYTFADYSADSVALAMERARGEVRSGGPEVSQRARVAAQVFELASVTDRFEAHAAALLDRRRS